jgi:hypothetical protein
MNASSTSVPFAPLASTVFSFDVFAAKTDTLPPFITAKGGIHGRHQEMRASGLYVSGDFAEVLQPAVRNDGRYAGRGLQVPSFRLQGQDRVRG